MSRAKLYVLNKYNYHFEYYNETEYSQNSREHLVDITCSFVDHPGSGAHGAGHEQKIIRPRQFSWRLRGSNHYLEGAEAIVDVNVPSHLSYTACWSKTGLDSISCICPPNEGSSNHFYGRKLRCYSML